MIKKEDIAEYLAEKKRNLRDFGRKIFKKAEDDHDNPK